MAEEQRRREKAERERDDLRRELYALREPRESPETVGEKPKRAQKKAPARRLTRSGGRTEALVTSGVRRVEEREGMAMDAGDAERRARETDLTREEGRYLARNSLVERLGVDPRLAEYLLELRERIEKLEDRLGAL